MWDLTLAPVCQTFDTSLETTRNVKNIQLFIKWFLPSMLLVLNLVWEGARITHLRYSNYERELIVTRP